MSANNLMMLIVLLLIVVLLLMIGLLAIVSWCLIVSLPHIKKNMIRENNQACGDIYKGSNGDICRDEYEDVHKNTYASSPKDISVNFYQNVYEGMSENIPDNRNMDISENIINSEQKDFGNNQKCYEDPGAKSGINGFEIQKKKDSYWNADVEKYDNYAAKELAVKYNAEKQIKITLSNPKEIGLLGYEVKFLEDELGKLVIVDEKGGEYYVRPFSNLISMQEYKFEAFEKCFKFDKEIKLGFNYKIVKIISKCIMRKEDGFYYVKEAGEIQIEKVDE